MTSLFAHVVIVTHLFVHVVIVTHLKFNWVENGDHPLDEWFQSSTAPIRTEFQPFKTCKIGESGKYFRITGHPSSINPRSWLAVQISDADWTRKLTQERGHSLHSLTDPLQNEQRNTLENRILYRTPKYSEQKQNKILEERTFFFLLFFLNSENVLISLGTWSKYFLVSKWTCNWFNFIWL